MGVVLLALVGWLIYRIGKYKGRTATVVDEKITSDYHAQVPGGGAGASDIRTGQYARELETPPTGFSSLRRHELDAIPGGTSGIGRHELDAHPPGNGVLR